jgi:hypothetical protein
MAAPLDALADRRARRLERFPVKMEMKFLSGESVVVNDSVPCPLGK